MNRRANRRAARRGGIRPFQTVEIRSDPVSTVWRRRAHVQCGTRGLTFFPTRAGALGNRLTSTELDAGGPTFVLAEYTANNLNQYTQISNLCDSASLGTRFARLGRFPMGRAHPQGADTREEFIPQYDLDGNQTLVKTSTGIWSVTYNGENRPVSWTCGPTNVVMSFDRMGRRVSYLETVSGGSQSPATVTNGNYNFVYDGYLCIQRIHGATKNVKLIFTWDPLETVATKPLMVEKPGSYKMHVTHDGNKNVSELVFFSGGSGIAAHYEYAPFGAITASTRSTSVADYDFRTYNPFRFSSEYADDKLGLVYYNYRHYNPADGRFVSVDILEIQRYGAFSCNPIDNADFMGLLRFFPFGNCPGNILNNIPPFWDAEVDGFSEMLWFATLRARSYTFKKGGRAYTAIYDELKEWLESRLSVDCKGGISGPSQEDLKKKSHYGGYLLTNMFSSSWGPLTYSFYTIGNAEVKSCDLRYSIIKENEPVGCCCYEVELFVSVDLSDVFDYVPDRKLRTAGDYVYNILAMPFASFYNGYIGASRPEVSAHIEETWRTEICGGVK